MKRPLVLGTVVGSGLLAIAVFGQQPQPGAPAPANAPRFPPITGIETIATNLYRVVGEGGNTAVLVHGNGVLLVDTKLANNGQAILDQVRKVTDKPITHIVNTHTHGDHTGSNSFFPASVEVVVQENTAANMLKMDAFKSDDRQGRPVRPLLQRQVDVVLREGRRRSVLLRSGSHQRRQPGRISRHARHALGRPVRDERAAAHRRQQRRQRRRVRRDHREGRGRYQERGQSHHRPQRHDAVAGFRRLSASSIGCSSSTPRRRALRA